MSSAFLLVAIWFLTLLGAEGCHDLEVSCTENVERVEALFSGNFTASSTVCVTLPSNYTETLDYRDTILPFNVVIRGNTNSTVNCVTDSDVENLTIYTHFPLRVHNAGFVEIEGVRFDGCKRPLQFQWVQQIAISSSHFT